jgi:hypothetical protein
MPVSVALDVCFEMLKYGELHSREGEVASR